MYFKEQRKKIYIILAVIIFLVVALAVGFWNSYVKGQEIGVAMLLNLVLIFAGFAYLFLEFNKTTDEQKLASHIHNKETLVREQVIAQYEADKNEETEVDTESQIKELVDKLKVSRRFKKVETFSEACLNNWSNILNISQGIFYFSEDNETFQPLIKYAFPDGAVINAFKKGEGITGQAAKGKDITVVEVPENYLKTESGLGESKPNNLILIPVFKEDKAIALFEIGIFGDLPSTKQTALQHLQGYLNDEILNLSSL